MAASNITGDAGTEDMATRDDTIMAGTMRVADTTDVVVGMEEIKVTGGADRGVVAARLVLARGSIKHQVQGLATASNKDLDADTQDLRIMDPSASSFIQDATPDASSKTPDLHLTVAMDLMWDLRTAPKIAADFRATIREGHTSHSWEECPGTAVHKGPPVESATTPRL